MSTGQLFVALPFLIEDREPFLPTRPIGAFGRIYVTTRRQQRGPAFSVAYQRCFRSERVRVFLSWLLVSHFLSAFTENWKHALLRCKTTHAGE